MTLSYTQLHPNWPCAIRVPGNKTLVGYRALLTSLGIHDQNPVQGIGRKRENSNHLGCLCPVHVHYFWSCKALGPKYHFILKTTTTKLFRSKPDTARLHTLWAASPGPCPAFTLPQFNQGRQEKEQTVPGKQHLLSQPHTHFPSVPAGLEDFLNCSLFNWFTSANLHYLTHQTLQQCEHG